VRVVPCLAVVGACLVLAGCSTFGKKTPNTATPAVRQGSDPALALPTDRIGALTPAGASGPPPGVSGLLAGQVLTSYNQQPPGAAFIQVTEPADAGRPAAAPIEVAADSQGYFTIQGLQPGRHYQLTARARSGDQVLAGTTWATPPDPKVLIRISEDFATAATPAIPGAPAWPPPKNGGGAGPPAAPGVARLPDPPAARADQGWSPGRGSPANANPNGSSETPRRALELGPPTGATPTTLPPPVRPQNITENNPGLAQNPVPVYVPPQGSNNPLTTRTTPRAGTQAPDAGAGPDPVLPFSGPTRVPSCVLTGQVLDNFALNDLSGQPWEYRRNHRGRLTLLDFWGTWCTHCLHAIPHLNIWQQRYGAQGLEVVGIAYEDGPLAKQAQAVNRVRQRLNMQYTLLLGGDRATCPVLTQFRVVSFPTLVLLDETGRIVWRSEGLDARTIQDLDTILRQRLAVR
jgi:thiol-disulfide isomerase/thioredoxin